MKMTKEEFELSEKLDEMSYVAAIWGTNDPSPHVRFGLLPPPSRKEVMALKARQQLKFC